MVNELKICGGEIPTDDASQTQHNGCKSTFIKTQIIFNTTKVLYIIKNNILRTTQEDVIS